MAEVLAAMAVGPLLSLVKEKASSYLLEQYNVMDGMEEQHKLLKRRLSYILDVIDDAEMQAAEHKEGAKAWLEEIRGVAYKANDVFDEFKYEALRRKAKKEGHYRELGMHFIKLFPTHNRIVFRYSMGNRLGMILKEIEVLVTEMNDFQLKFQSQQQVSMNWRQTDSNIVGPAEIVKTSRDEEKKKVVDTLLGQGGNKDLTVLPIFGMGGLGKTTLAQLVYNDSKIKKHFQLLLWVCVSDNFDVDFLATSIVKAANAKENKNGSITDEKDIDKEVAARENKNVSVTDTKDIVKEAAAKENRNGSGTDGKPPLDSLREVLSGKRYLLVLDDVWNRDPSKWDKLKSCLDHGGMGSSVLTTTRDDAIAQLMGTIEAYKLSLLGKNFIEEIIKTKAFSSKDESPADELVAMVGDMAKRCAGSPLAATALGSILRTKHSVGEWKDVLSRSTICNEETGILPTLKLSYNDLPSQMRQCFSFCAMFPKDYEIDVDTLIQLWMANGFILEEQGVCPEIRGKQIFNELVSRSFFQDVKEIPFDVDYFVLWGSEFRYCSRSTCKIHDLMHDVAQSAMGKECATIAIKPSETEKLPSSTRHLFVPHYDPGVILNRLMEERFSPALQTLLCTKGGDEELRSLSKYNSIRALQIKEHSSLKPKFLHHMRYLDVSRSDIKALPEDISILYHLQTLDVSDCDNLTQLPKNMKYMTALRHLYTHGCSELKMMPPELRCLASLQKMTCFVAGTPDSSCSNMGELGLLDLGGHLEVRQLENVAETDARAANLGNKKKLTELRLEWTSQTSREPQQQHHKVLDALRPHVGIKALRIYGYGGSTYPTWINTLEHMVELVLCDCNMVKKLPPLWQLQDLQVLYVKNMENIRCFCDGDPPFTFNKLKELILYGMGNLETWWDINELQGKEPMFPEVEKLSIRDCGKLTALPRASVITVTSDDGVNTEWRSPFPALKELEVIDLASFQSWEAVEGTIGGEQMTTFPWLKKLSIEKCPELTSLPEAPKLSVLQILEVGSQELFVHAARYITSLSELVLSVNDRETALPREDSLIELVNNTEKWSHESSLVSVSLSGGCDFLFPHSSSAPGLWNCLVQLQDLKIRHCHALVHWPENVFRCLVSLRKLDIVCCNKLTGCMQASDEQSTPGRSVLPPRLESLWLRGCESLVEVPLLPASLTTLYISRCQKLESVVLRKQQNTSMAEVPNPSPPIRDLTIQKCRNLLSLSVQLDLPSSLDDLPSSLECLKIVECDSLESIPDVPQAYTSLRDLTICNCPRLKVLPPFLKQRLNYIEHPYLDARHTGPKLSRPSAWKYAISRHC